MRERFTIADLRRVREMFPALQFSGHALGKFAPLPDVPPEKAHLLEALIGALDEWDPAEVTHERYGNPREYEQEARLILAMAAKAPSPEELTGQIWRLFQRQFGEDDAGPREAYEWVARKALES